MQYLSSKSQQQRDVADEGQSVAGMFLDFSHEVVPLNFLCVRVDVDEVVWTPKLFCT